MNYIDIIEEAFIKNKYRSYLEIGCQYDACFRRIPAERKVGVDPYMGGTHRMTSSQYWFENAETFDCIFIDGLHESSQVYEDIINAMHRLNPGGVIFVHDIHPESEIMQRVPRETGEWTGDVWKAWKKTKHECPDFEFEEIDIKYGLGKIRHGKNPEPMIAMYTNEMTYSKDYASKNHA